MCASQPFSASSEQELLESQLQRYRRVLGFAGNFARAKQKEFALLWQRPNDFGPKAQDFCKRVDGLLAKVKEGEKILGYARGQPARAAFNALGSFDLNALTRATKGLEGVAAELKAEPALQRAMTGVLSTPASRLKLTDHLRRVQQRVQTAPLDVKPRTDALADMMKSWMTMPSVVKAGPTPAQVEAETADRVLEQNRLALEAAMELVSKVLKAVSPRLHVVEVALRTTGLPGRPRAWEDVEAEIPEIGRQNGFSAAQIGWLFHLADLFLGDPRAVQVAHMAVVQWSQARVLLEDARLVRETMSTAPAAKSQALLRDFNLGRFRASAFPLSHLHLSFKGLHLLQDMFPEPT